MQGKHSKIYDTNDLPSKTIGKNLSFLMKKYGVDAQKLSDATGVGIATIKNLRRGSGNPTILTLMSIADFFQVTVGDLTDTESVQLMTPSRTHILSIPLVKYSDIESFISGSYVPTQKYTAEFDHADDGSLFAFEVTNNAFSPELERSSICIVSLKEKSHDGDIVLVKTKDYPVFLRRAFVGNKCMFFCNISLDADAVPVEFNDYKIVGVLLKIIKRLK